MGKLFEKYQNYFKRFLHEDDGSQLIEWAVIIIIAVGLIVAGYAIYANMSTKMDQAKNVLESVDVPADLGGNGGGGGAQPLPGK